MNEVNLPQSSPEQPAQKRRLYRNPKDKILGGVCSGIAGFFDIDPSIVRIVFAICCLSGWGIFAYIILWIVVPEEEHETYQGKRLHRDPKKAVFGGVASGIAGYFNQDVTIVRLIFLAPIILNIVFGVAGWPFVFTGLWVPNIIFGSLTGTVVFVYIMLWIILPESKAELAPDDDVKKKEISKTVAEPSKIGSVIGGVFRFLLFVLAVIILISLVSSLSGLLFVGAILTPIYGFLWTSAAQEYFALATLFLFFGIPIIALIVWLIRRIVGAQRNKYLGWTFGLLWAMGFVSVVFFVASLAKDLRYYEQSAPIDIPVAVAPQDNRLTVTVSEPALRLSNDYWWFDDAPVGFDLSEDALRMTFVKFKIMQSKDSQYHIAINKFSAGRSLNDATARAEQVQFRASYKDGTLDLGNSYTIAKESKYRGQIVEVEIRIPAGNKIRFEESVLEKLNPVSFKLHKTKGWRNTRFHLRFDHHHSFPWQGEVDYIMGEDGQLKRAK